MRISKQIGWSTESNLTYEIIKQVERLNTLLPGNQPSYKVNISKQIGWSTEANLYYEWLVSLTKLVAHAGCPCTTTTTTTAGPIDSSLSIDLGVAAGLFDIPWGGANFGCWLNMTVDSGFPRIFSFGQYPNADQAISIENDTLYFWYGGTLQLYYTLTSYIGQWIWINLNGSSGNVSLWINGTQVANTTVTVPQITFANSTIYIGSENAPNTYLNGLIAGLIFDVQSLDLRPIPTSPIIPSGNTMLLIGQGTDLTQQLTDQSVFGYSVTNSNCVYSTNSPYSPAVGGSIQFGS